jgi:xanthine dehydrogenase large subunit
MLAISVREAIRDAVAAFGNGGPVVLPSPATPEHIFFAIRRAREMRDTAATIVHGEVH